MQAKRKNPSGLGLEEFLQMFGLLLDARDRARSAGLQDLERLCTMSLMQILADWDQLDLDAATNKEIEKSIAEMRALRQAVSEKPVRFRL